MALNGMSSEAISPSDIQRRSTWTALLGDRGEERGKRSEGNTFFVTELLFPSVSLIDQALALSTL